MNKDEVVEKLLDVAVNGKISCTEAREIMKDYNVPNGLLGKICDELGIKIYGCELGCF
ncbi:MAG TPA: hypothetical protein PKV15_06615 [Syntrophomonadaceae bacterium]|nr:hypothetical protein [Syntrophomonadaceae bacterium]HRX20881.1 hypothetical protein [Syntrophomonadaceae bacterium]